MHEFEISNYNLFSHVAALNPRIKIVLIFVNRSFSTIIIQFLSEI